MSLTKITNRVIEPGTITANSLSENISVGGGDDVIINQIIITDENFANTENTQIPTTGGYLKIYGSGFQANANVYISTSFSLGSQVTANVVSSTEIRVTISAIEANTFNLFVFNPNGTQISKLNAVTSFVLQATAGWFGGSITTISRIIFATDTATGSARGNFTKAASAWGATGNFNYGWFGLQGTTLERISFSADTETALVRGPLSGTIYRSTATGNNEYGWWAGGGPSVGSSRIERVTFVDDTAAASIRGPLSLSRRGLASTGNDNFGWFGGGENPGAVSTVDRITFSSDTDTASVRGPLSQNKLFLTATGNDNFGWFGGGALIAGSSPVSRVDRITFSSDTGTASVRGPLSIAKYFLTANGNDEYGWFGHGWQEGAPVGITTVERITFTDDTITASVRGPLNVGRTFPDSVSGIA